MADIIEARRKKSEDLAGRGFGFLREGDYEAALEVAKELEEIRYTAAFDIAAQALAGLGKLEKAVETLERGVKEAPDSWLNWQLLGNYRSDMGDFEGALDAYERALTCQGVWEDSIRLNQAILASRCGDHERSLIHLDMVRDPELSLQVTAAKMTALQDIGRLNEALSLADTCLSQEGEVEDEDETLAQIAAKQGRLRLTLGYASDDVRCFAMDALETFHSNSDLLALIRDIDGRYSDKAQYLRLLVDGCLHDGHPLRQETKGYFVTYDVVAETQEQALGWVREFEDADNSEIMLRIEESEVLEERPDDPMGIYWRSDRCYYGDEDD